MLLNWIIINWYTVLCCLNNVNNEKNENEVVNVNNIIYCHVNDNISLFTRIKKEYIYTFCKCTYIYFFSWIAEKNTNKSYKHL